MSLVAWLQRKSKKRRNLKKALRAGRKDIFLHSTETAHNNAHDVVRRLLNAGAMSFDLVVAHEARISGIAGLRAAEITNASLRILDNVEYPLLAGRSSTALRMQGERDPLGDRLLSAWLAAVTGSYDHIFASSEGQRDALTSIGVQNPIRLLRNARFHAQPIRDTSIRDHAGCAEGDVLILCLGTVYVDGGAAETIRALQTLPPRFRLCFLGRMADDQARLNELISQLSLQDRVVFLQLVSPGLLIQYISGADVAIIPLLPVILNHQHCLPNRIFEAIAARIPIVAPSMIESGRFVRQHGIGATFDDFEPATIAAAIREVTDLHRECRLAQPLEHAASTFTWEREQSEMADIISKLPGRKALLVAVKDISRNDRIHRITGTLRDQGFDTTVVAGNLPMPELRREDVHYIELRAERDGRPQKTAARVLSPSTWLRFRKPASKSLRVRSHEILVAPDARYDGFWDRFAADTWEPSTLDVIEGFVRPGSLYIDIGSWIGPTVLLAGKLGARVVAFEPDPVSVKMLETNVALNGLSRVEIVPQALSSRAERRALYAEEFGLSTTRFGAAFMREGQLIQLTQSMNCETMGAKDAAQRFAFEQAAFIKMDIEGAEYEVIPELADFFAQYPIPFHLSLHPNVIGYDRMSATEGAALRRELSLRVLRALPHKRLVRCERSRVTPTTRAQLEAEIEKEGELSGMLLFLPE